MNINLLTKEDLLTFKFELLEDIGRLLKQDGGHQEYLKSKEVQSLLKVSSGTLQNLRVNGTLPCKKINGTLYYKRSDIEKLLQ